MLRNSAFDVSLFNQCWFRVLRTDAARLTFRHAPLSVVFAVGIPFLAFWSAHIYIAMALAGIRPYVSIDACYDGAVVFLTGGLGFLGSVVLEQLLRLTKVSRIFVLVRAKKGRTAAERTEKLLCSALFNQLHKAAAAGSPVFQKVQAVEGDLTLPELGLSIAAREALCSAVNIVLHCAALIELEADVQKTLTNNYLGTQHLMTLAADMKCLRSFVFTSTYFVNNFLTQNSVVEERIYDLPISLNGRAASADEFVKAMLSLSPEEANRQTKALMQQLHFASTYAFGKYLTEVMFKSSSMIPSTVTRAIVRPSLIASIAQSPYPGFISGYAGAGGYCMAYALGFFQGRKSLAYNSDTFLDLIPADSVAALVIAAAADTATSPTVAIYHATSSGSHPLLIGYALDRMRRFWKDNPPPIKLPFTRMLKLGCHRHHPTAQGIAWGRKLAELKINMLELPMRLMGQHKVMHLLRMGFKAFSIQNSLPYAVSLVCAVDKARELQLRLVPEERKVWPVVWEPTVMSWEEWGATYLAGVHQLLFQIGQPVKGVAHHFVKRPEASPDSLRMTAAIIKMGLDMAVGSDSMPPASYTPEQCPSTPKATAAVTAYLDATQSNSCSSSTSSHE